MLCQQIQKSRHNKGSLTTTVPATQKGKEITQSVETTWTPIKESPDQATTITTTGAITISAIQAGSFASNTKPLHQTM
jgi:hypothetical protein